MSFTFGKRSAAEDSGVPSAKKAAPTFSFGAKAAGGGGSGGFAFGKTPAAAAASGGGGFSFGKAPAAGAGFGFGSSKKRSPAGDDAGSSGAGGGGEPSAKKAAPTFSFGKPSAAGDGGSGGFSFGAAPAAPTASSTGGFKFGSSPAASGGASAGGGFSFSTKPAAAGVSTAGGFNFKAAPAAKEATEGDDDDVPHENQGPEIAKSQDSESETVVEEHMAKLYKFTDTEKELKDRCAEAEGGTDADKKQAQDALEAGRKVNFKEWKLRGKSTLKLLESKETGKRMLRMRSENGQQMLLNDWCSSTKATKKGTDVITLVTTSGATAGTHMIKVNKAKRDGLFDAIHKTGTPGKGAAAMDAPAAAATAAAIKPPAAKQPAAVSTQPAATKKLAVTAASDSHNAPSAESGSLMHALNQSFAKWIRDSIEKDPACDLSPCLEDYLEHVAKMKADTDDGEEV